MIETGLNHVQFDSDGRPGRVTLETFGGADVIVDPRLAFGQPIIEAQGVRVEDVADLFFAGESIGFVCDEFGVPHATVEAIVRAYGQRAA